MSTQNTTLLIVGAGPTGLSAAISLVKNGFTDFVIVDQASSVGETTRAITLHAATMEALESIGCADCMTKVGLPGKTVELCDRKNKIPVTDYSCLSSYTKFPYVLLLSQKDIEELLQKHLRELGIIVQRGEKVVDVKTRGDGRYEVAFDSAEAGVIVTSHIIGADGARSVIRQVSGIDFKDPDGDMPDARLRQIILADVSFSADSPMLPKAGMLGTGVGGAMSFIIALPRDPQSLDQKYRLGFSITEGEAPRDPSIEFLQDCMNNQGPIPLSSDPSVNPNPVHISKKLWSSRFRTHSAIADTFMKASGSEHASFILLIGDAAHIHAPAGGLGMNLGIRDAVGLGPVLAKYLNSSEGNSEVDLEVLTGYIQSRRDKALSQIRLTKRILKGASIFSLGGTFNFQYWLLRIMGSISPFRNKVAWALSGLGNR